MLTDVLGVTIAFITLLLLLSLLVTSAVQASQAVLRLRARNLMKGLAELIARVRMERGTHASRGLMRKAKKDATRILNASHVALINQVKEPTAWYRYWLFGPKVSWIQPDDIPEAVREQAGGLEKHVEQLQGDFKRSSRMLERRFQLVMRMWTFGWALLLAFGFQASTFALLGDLATDAERRERILANSGTVLAQSQEAIAGLDRDSATESAALKLESLFPQYRELIQRASRRAVSNEFIWEELAIALEDVPGSDQILDQFEQLVEDAVGVQAAEAKAEAERNLGRLEQFDLRLWPNGWTFYADSTGLRLNNVIGVFVTAILLSLGAPFWYERMRDAIHFRDVLAGPKASTGQAGDSAKAGSRSTQE